MCFPRQRFTDPDQRAMSEKHRVPVFDPESKDLRKVPLKKINSSFIILVFGDMEI